VKNRGFVLPLRNDCFSVITMRCKLGIDEICLLNLEIGLSRITVSNIVNATYDLSCTDKKYLDEILAVAKCPNTISTGMSIGTTHYKDVLTLMS